MKAPPHHIYSSGDKGGCTPRRLLASSSDENSNPTTAVSQDTASRCRRGHGVAAGSALRWLSPVARASSSVSGAAHPAGSSNPTTDVQLCSCRRNRLNPADRASSLSPRAGSAPGPAHGGGDRVLDECAREVEGHGHHPPLSTTIQPRRSLSPVARASSAPGLALGGGEHVPDEGAHEVEGHRHGPDVVPGAVLEDPAGGVRAHHPRQHTRRVGDPQQHPAVLRPDVLMVGVEPGLAEGVEALGGAHARHRRPGGVDVGQLRQEEGGAHEAHRLHHLPHPDGRHAALHELVRCEAAHVGGEGHGDPRQHAVEPALLHVHPQYLVVVGGHPREEDEGAPVVAEVAHDDGPHRAARHDLLPRDARGGAPLHRVGHDVVALRRGDLGVLQGGGCRG
mmetsp:Transcript_34740/g.75953  ORF Transcript_34740/g.75953 Transcript_34740/m.75953 type:complete len:393 (+) Transcript_34740:385-1563(+)